MKVAFRTDASLQIGTGHVMRCLTLADALAERGAECHFLCRLHQGHLIDFIRDKGYAVHALPVDSVEDAGAGADFEQSAATAHAGWLGATQTQDAEACTPMLATLQPDWMIVDHYALEATWECALSAHFGRLLVIDDLADRPHLCDLLLDQTYGRNEADYRPLVPASCQLLCGAQYALLRPEFAALRPYSLQRRTHPVLRELLITMGGVDKDNATGAVLEALRACPLPEDCSITVVMGQTAPWLDDVRNQARDMPRPTRVLAGVNNMAQLMANSDLAIGAAGATSWERCCLGLPTLILGLAENQKEVAQGLQRAGAAEYISGEVGVSKQLGPKLLSLVVDSSRLSHMSECAARILDGTGVDNVIRGMEV